MEVYVKDEAGRPLMPTTRCGHVRILLKEGKAKVVGVRPFTIQLKHEVDEKERKVLLGIDPGRTNIGLNVIDESGASLMSIDAVTRNKDVPGLMSSRKESRVKHRHLKRRRVRQRRAKKAGTSKEGDIIRRLPKCEKDIVCHDIKNKESRFCNRKRPEGWLTPTANQLLESHINLVKLVEKYLPVTDIVIEVNRFTFMALDNPNVKKWQYARGPLYKKGSVDDAVYELQGGKCLLCGKDIDDYHHIVPRSKGGSDTIDNKAGLCRECHKKVHTDKKMYERLLKKKKGLNRKYGAPSVLNQIIPSLIKELGEMFPGHVYLTDGRSTKAFRDEHGIEKDHCLDAYCIACSVLDDIKPGPEEDRLLVYQYRRHDRQACHQERLDRKYCIGKKVVCMNRHKRIEQKTDSLEEYRQTHSQKEISRLKVREHEPQYKDMERIMPGALMINTKTKTVFVLGKTSGRHGGTPDNYISVSGNYYTASKCRLLQKNKGFIFV